MQKLYQALMLTTIVGAAAMIGGVSDSSAKLVAQNCSGLSEAECTCTAALDAGTQDAIDEYLNLFPNADTACNATASTLYGGPDFGKGGAADGPDVVRTVPTTPNTSSSSSSNGGGEGSSTSSTSGGSSDGGNTSTSGSSTSSTSGGSSDGGNTSTSGSSTSSTSGGSSDGGNTSTSGSSGGSTSGGGDGSPAP